MTFNKNMNFTNEVHNNIAMPKFYIPRGMTKVVSEVGTLQDLRDGIDYTIYEGDDILCTVQERFRKSEYKHYRDITFRYDKPSASGDQRREFFKIKADVFLYGIINDTNDDFEWAYMFWVSSVVEAIKNGSMPSEYHRNKGHGDTGFIAINISDIDKIGATIDKYNL